MDEFNVPTNTKGRYLAPIMCDPGKMENMKAGHEVEVKRV
jgi:hypothetical protein